MAETGDVVVDWGLNVDPAIAAAKKLEAVLDGIHAKLHNTSGLVANQVKATVDEYNRLIATIDQSKPGGRMQALALESRKNTDVSRQVKSYEDYGTRGPAADDMRDLMVAFRRELNANRQTSQRLFSTLAKDMIQGQIDAIRTQVDVAKARIMEETFQASTLLRRTTPEALRARAALDEERIARTIRSADARQIEFRELRDRTREERNLNGTLQQALAAQRARNDQKTIFNESSEGQLRRTVDEARKEASGLNAYLDNLAAANRRAAEEENRRRDQASRSLRQEAEDVNQRRDQADRALRVEADVENRRRDLADRHLRRSAEDENQRRDQAAKRLRREADEDNRRRDQADRALRAEAEEFNRRRDQADRHWERTYAAAERENRMRDRLRANEGRERISEIRNTPEMQEVRERRAQRSVQAERDRDRLGDAAYSNRQIMDRISDPSFLGVQATIMGNYFAIAGIINTIRGLGRFITDFDEQLHQLKAISEATNTEMERLGTTFINVAATSKFSANDVAKAATTMAQAGLSAQQIEKSIGSVVKLATASGSSLDASVDLTTSILGAFQISGGEVEKIADVVTEALNRTKLSVDKLALGFQYAANIAADSGITYTELTAILGQLSQTGIRSGSTLGTGLRQLLVDLSKPSEKFQEIVEGLGLTMSQVDVKTNGFLGVLANLKNAGFTAADAIQSFEVRAASSYTALANNVDAVTKLNDSFATTKAAATAAETQMESFNATYQNLLNRIAAATYSGFAPIIDVLQKALAGAGQLFGVLGQYPAILQTIGATVTAVIGVTAIGLIGKLASAAALAAGQMRVMQLAMGALSLGGLIPGWVGLAAAVGATALGFTLFNDTVDETADRAEKLKTAGKTIEGALDSTNQSITQVDATIRTLTQQRRTLESNPVLSAAKIAEVRAQFADLGLEIDRNTNSIGALISRLEQLNQKLAGKAVLQYTEQLSILEQQQRLLNKEIDKETGSAANPYGKAGAPPGKLRQALLDVFPLFGSKVQQPRTAQEFEDLRSRITIRNNDLAAERFTLDNKERRTPAEDARLKEIDRITKPIEGALALINSIGQKLREAELNTQQQQTLREAREAKAFRETEQGLALGRAGQALNAFAVRAPIQFGQSSDEEGAFGRIKAEQDRLVREQTNAVDKARDLLMSQGRTFEQANKILSDSGLEQSATEAQENVRNAVNKIDESMNALLKKRTEQITDRIGELSRSVTINSSFEKIDAAIAGVTDGVASKFDAVAQQVKGFNYVSSSSKGDIMRRATELAKQEGVDPAAILALIQKESGFNRNARPIDPKTGVPLSSANGLFQFLSSTGKRYGYTPGVDLDTELRAGIAFYKNNQNLLTKSLKREANPFENYLAHMLGFGGAKRALNANADARAADPNVLGILASNNGSRGKRANETVGDFLARHKATFEKFYGGALDVGEKLQSDVNKLDDLNKLRDKAKSKRVSDELEAASKRQLQELDNLASEARRAKNPDAVAGLIKRAQELGPEIIDKQIKSLRESPEFRDRLDEPSAQSELRDREVKLRQAITQKINKLIDARYEAAVKQANQPVEEAELRLSTLKNNVNDGNVTSVQIQDADNALQEAKRVRALKLEEIQAQKTAEMTEALNKARASGDIDAVTAANERLTDAIERQATATNEAAIANTRVASLSYGAATQDGTYNFFKSAGMFDREGQLKSGAQQWGEAWTQALGGVQGGLEQLSISMANDPKSWTKSIKSFGLSFIQMFQQMIAKALSLQILMSVFGTSKDGAGGGGLLSGLLGGLGGGGGGGDFLGGLFGVEPFAFAGGGEVTGGTPNRDSVLAKLMPGEVVMRKSAVDAIGKDQLLALNSMGSNVAQMNQPKAMASQPRPDGTPVNVYVVAPDEKPSMGPKDVIAVIADDMKRKGATRQLVRAIQNGQA